MPQRSFTCRGRLNTVYIKYKDLLVCSIMICPLLANMSLLLSTTIAKRVLAVIRSVCTIGIAQMSRSFTLHHQCWLQHDSWQTYHIALYSTCHYWIRGDRSMVLGWWEILGHYRIGRTYLVWTDERATRGSILVLNYAIWRGPSSRAGLDAHASLKVLHK